FELLNVRFDLRPPVGGDFAGPLREVLTERLQRFDVIVELELHLADVVEDAIRRRELVRAAELGEGSLEARLAEKLNAFLETSARFLDGPLRRRRLIGRSENGSRRRGERERDDGGHRGSRRPHWPYGSFSSMRRPVRPVLGRCRSAPGSSSLVSARGAGG